MAKQKQARDLRRAIEKAGGRCEPTRSGHLRVYGPKGVAHVSLACTGPRAWANTLATITRTGLGRVAL